MLKMVADVTVHAKLGEFSVDVFIPDWKLAVEYQGGQHSKQTWRGDFKRQISFSAPSDLFPVKFSETKTNNSTANNRKFPLCK